MPALGSVTVIENDAFEYDQSFQKDRTPPHIYVPVREYLDKVFLGCCIGNMEWPQSSSFPWLHRVEFCNGEGIVNKIIKFSRASATGHECVLY